MGGGGGPAQSHFSGGGAWRGYGAWPGRCSQQDAWNRQRGSRETDRRRIYVGAQTPVEEGPPGRVLMDGNSPTRPAERQPFPGARRRGPPTLPASLQQASQEGLLPFAEAAQTGKAPALLRLAPGPCQLLVPLDHPNLSAGAPGPLGRKAWTTWFQEASISLAQELRFLGQGQDPASACAPPPQQLPWPRGSPLGCVHFLSVEPQARGRWPLRVTPVLGKSGLRQGHPAFRLLCPDLQPAVGTRQRPLRCL